MNIVRSARDKEHFVRSLFILNDRYQNTSWIRDTALLSPFERPAAWPDRKPLCHVLAWTLMGNHFHLLLQEISDGGIAKFMQRLCGSMTLSFNKKYEGRGTIFQSGYKGVIIESDAHLQYVTFYIVVKNVLELYPGGLAAAAKNFDHAWQWALQYPFSSLPVQALRKNSPICNDDEKILAELCRNPRSFKASAKEAFKIHMQTRPEEFAKLMLEEW